MTIFDAIRDICYAKTNRLCDRIDWPDLKLSPYMMQRWISMTSPMNAYLANEFTNCASSSTTTDSEEMYHYLSAFAQPCGKYRYLKTNRRVAPLTEERQKEATSLEISLREARMYDKMIAALESKK